MKTIEDVVIRFDGLWQECFDVGFAPLGITRSEFESAASKMGYINGYRWGVEYPTNGKRPDLPDDLLVDRNYGYRFEHGQAEVSCVDWLGCKSFKITDPRYKPADTSYLKKVSEAERFGIMPPMNINERCDLNNWHERGELPPVGELCEFRIALSKEYSKCTFVGINSNKNFVIEAYGKYSSYHEGQIEFRPIRTHREKVIEAAISIARGGLTKEMYSALYDAGMLVLPQDSSDTKN